MGLPCGSDCGGELNVQYALLTILTATPVASMQSPTNVHTHEENYMATNENQYDTLLGTIDALGEAAQVELEALAAKPDKTIYRLHRGIDEATTKWENRLIAFSRAGSDLDDGSTLSDAERTVLNDLARAAKAVTTVIVDRPSAALWCERLLALTARIEAAKATFG